MIKNVNLKERPMNIEYCAVVVNCVALHKYEQFSFNVSKNGNF